MLSIMTELLKKLFLVFSNIEIGKNYNSNDLNQIIKDLYETNFFSNVNFKFR